MTLGVVKIAPHVSPSNKVDIIRSSGSNLFGKNAIIITTAIKAHAKNLGCLGPQGIVVDKTQVL
jgi:hypothetical protein